MYWLVESDFQLSWLRGSGYKEAFVEIIGIDHNLHPAENKPSVIYIRPTKGEKGYMIPINHTEGFNVSKKQVVEILQKFEVLFTSDKKSFWHYFHLDNLHDFILSAEDNSVDLTDTHKIFYKKYPNQQNVNKIVPIVKHYQYCEAKYEQLKDKIKKHHTKYEQFYNKRVSLVYYNIERNSIGIDVDKFFKHFYNRPKPWVYTQYNLNTTTTRPSNKFGGVNYAALNKKTGERACFVPKNDYFVEFDITAYHPMIVSHLIGYKFEIDDVHQEFANMYKTSREKAKELTFQQFYGRIFAKYKDLRYFKLLLQKQDELKNFYEQNGYLEEPLSGYRFYKSKLGDISKEKLFNYFLQATESSINVQILHEIQKKLENRLTQIVLTVYDSFLFDVKSGEENLLKEISEIFQTKKFKTSIKSGYDYDFR